MVPVLSFSPGPARNNGIRASVTMKGKTQWGGLLSGQGASVAFWYGLSELLLAVLESVFI